MKIKEIKTEQELKEEFSRRNRVILNYYGFETPFQTQQFHNCHEEMKKLEAQLNYHLTRLRKQ